jgi:hypothetical protein
MRKVILILMLLMFKVFYCKTKEDEQECCLNTNKATKNDKNAEIFLSNFNDLNELKFNCQEEKNIEILAFQPNKPIIFDDSLDIKNLKIISNSKILAIVLYNFKGIDLSSNPFNNLEKKIYFQYESIFDFYINKKLIDKTNCNDQITSRSIIQQTLNLIVSNPNKNSGETCPFVFKNSLIALFSINNLRYSLIYTSSFTFQNKSIQNNLNCSIFQTDLEMFHSNLNSKLLNAHVFRNLTILDINGIINRIEADVFKNLKQLHLLRIKSQNVKNIFSRDNKWFEYLNKNDDSRLSSVFIFLIHQLYENVTFYLYPKEDFCFFKYFPHQRLVLPILTPNSKSKCSCTELFLIQNSIKYQNQIERRISNFGLNYLNDYYDNSNKLFPDCINNGNTIEDLIEQCEFQKRLKLCEYEQIKIDGNSNLDIYLEDLMQFSDLIEIVFKKYLNLIFVIITLLINILMVVILSSKSLKDRMYTYLNINSVFNLLSCLITIIDYIASDCSGHLYCPKSIAYQYYYIILIKIISNSVKTCSNMAHLSFSLSRFKKIKGKDFIFIKSLNGLSFKLYLFLIITFSIGINLYVYFKFSIKLLNGISETDGGNSLKINYFSTINKNDYNKVNFSDTEYIILNIFQCLKLIFSDFTYIIATTVVDILLFKIVKKQMENKRKILINLNQNNRTEINNNKKKKENNKLSADHRISRMIILNGINYLLFRFPYSIFNFYVLIFRHDLKANKHFPNLASFLVCHKFNFCQSIGEIFYSLYLISFFIQFVVFYKLDKNFKESCLSIVTKFKKIFNSFKNRIRNR